LSSDHPFAAALQLGEVWLVEAYRVPSSSRSMKMLAAWEIDMREKKKLKKEEGAVRQNMRLG
jgi:hypothetical protein